MSEENMDGDLENETGEVEVWEFALSNEEIDDLVTELNTLKESKESFSFDLDEDNELLVHHEDNEVGGEE